MNTEEQQAHNEMVSATTAKLQLETARLVEDMQTNRVDNITRIEQQTANYAKLIQEQQKLKLETIWFPITLLLAALLAGSGFTLLLMRLFGKI